MHAIAHHARKVAQQHTNQLTRRGAWPSQVEQACLALGTEPFLQHQALTRGVGGHVARERISPIDATHTKAAPAQIGLDDQGEAQAMVRHRGLDLGQGLWPRDVNRGGVGGGRACVLAHHGQVLHLALANQPARGERRVGA